MPPSHSSSGCSSACLWAGNFGTHQSLMRKIESRPVSRPASTYMNQFTLNDARLPPRFWSKVSVDGNGCWMWTASVRGGYACYRIGGAGTPCRGGHIHAYEILIGQVGEGLELDHLCRHPLCVNPAHLEPVTPTVNKLRSDSPWAMNARKTHCPRGHEYDVVSVVDGRKQRKCRQCLAINTRNYRARKAAINGGV